jgi:transposase
VVVQQLKNQPVLLLQRHCEYQWTACYLSGSKVKNKKGVPELQIIVSFNKPDQAQSIYKQRWQIETAFRALKTSGFNIEDTHLTDMKRIEKLLALVIVAFVWAYKAGIFLTWTSQNQKEKEIDLYNIFSCFSKNFLSAYAN